MPLPLILLVVSEGKSTNGFGDSKNGMSNVEI